MSKLLESTLKTAVLLALICPALIITALALAVRKDLPLQDRLIDWWMA